MLLDRLVSFAPYLVGALASLSAGVEAEVRIRAVALAWAHTIGVYLAW